MPEKNKSPLITVLTVNYNTSDFIEVMLHAFRHLTDNSWKAIICDNGSNDRHLVRLAQIARQYDNVEVIYRLQSAPGSVGHGEALDILTNKIDTPYFVVMDSDASFLFKGWDTLLLTHMDKQVKAIGTQAPGNKPKDFPLMFAMLFETLTFKLLDISFLPETEALASNKQLDTGWQLRERFHAAGYQGKVIEFRSTRTWKQGPFGDMLVAEFYQEGINEIVASHYGRGSTSGLAKHNAWWRRFSWIGGWRAACERREWIKRVRHIVNQESSKSVSSKLIRQSNLNT